MMGMGTLEILLIVLVIVFFFGAKKLPDIGRGLGSGIRNFKGELKSEESEEQDRVLPPEDPGVTRE
ncbi:MAG TPA: twin-arginine translocase TatA/TatE family subunit [Gemmatimonadetes bacterium]|nr:twin-arginine translocase TatA/TatE family subunit [Gemmatimonadota bacterium]|tara:strand:+ start:675 stop:872 length:198 start_codon:yes stop_codon:yes gene_type:complete